MNCNDVRDNLSLYIDDELNEQDKKLMVEHLQSCSECSKELEEYRKIIQALSELPEEEPPVGYCKRLHEKLLDVSPEMKNDDGIAKINEIPKKKNSKFKWVKYGGLAAAFALVVLVAGLNSGLMGGMGKSSYDMANRTQSAELPAEYPATESAPMAPSMDYRGSNDYYMADSIEDEKAAREEQGIMATEGSGQMSTMSVNEREMKIIKTGNLYVQTKDYDSFLNDITSKVQAIGGFVENNTTEVYQVYEDNKLMRGRLKIRVPQENFYETVNYLEETSDIRRKNINEQDVTKEYYEKDNKVKNLEIQEQNLRELFEKATTVEEMLQIENELRRIRTEIDALNISLADINDRAAMSTIDMEVEEVKEINFTLKSEKGVLERSKEGFIRTINSIVRGIGNLIVNLVSSLPILMPVIIILVVLLLQIKKYWKKKI